MDTIEDFDQTYPSPTSSTMVHTNDHDVIRFEDGQFANFDALVASGDMTQSGANVVIKYGATDQVTMLNVKVLRPATPDRSVVGPYPQCIGAGPDLMRQLSQLRSCYDVVLFCREDGSVQHEMPPSAFWTIPARQRFSPLSVGSSVGRIWSPLDTRRPLRQFAIGPPYSRQARLTARNRVGC
jgi:hypothetical protein